MRNTLWLLIGLLSTLSLAAQQPSAYYILADRVFDGEQLHTGWAVLVEADKIKAAGPAAEIPVPADATKIQLPNTTLMPGLIEGHSHMLLYPYNQTDWDTQVLKESDALRTIRATVHLRNTLMAGFTTARDLGTEGAGYSDVALKQAVEKGIIPGPRLLVAGRAIVATGAYGPMGYDGDSQIMLGAQPADGPDLVKVTREQIGHGIDQVKVYADYYWGPNHQNKPTFSQEELTLIRETAASAGRPMVVHASTKEGMRRSILAGAETVEHGDWLDEETAQLMKAHQVTLVPTLAAVEAIAQYRGWQKDKMPEPANLQRKRKSFQIAMAAGVTIGMGGDVGVFAHGNNVREMELMAEWGMKPIDVLKAATTVNARAFHIDTLTGSIRPMLKADLIIVEGDPTKNISACRKVKWVMKDGVVYKSER